MSTRKLVRSSLFGAVLLLVLPSPAVWAQGRPFEVLQQQINQLQAQINSLQSALAAETSARMAADAALQAQVGQVNSLAAIAPYVSLQTVNGQPTVRFSAVNVQVVNGQGVTASANGKGNLIVGYDEPNAAALYNCTIGIANFSTQTPVVDEPSCVSAGGQWLISFKTGSHYLVLGQFNNYSRWGGLVAGQSNTSNYDFASVSGGWGNTASGWWSSVSGGQGNKASGQTSSVSGGAFNTASGPFSSVGGGGSNTASGNDSSVSGGVGNTASEVQSSVSGGYGNTASGQRSSVSGGILNTAGGYFSSVLGGNGQNAGADYQTIPALP